MSTDMPDDKPFFDWLREQQTPKALTQDHVDAGKALLQHVTPTELQDLLAQMGLGQPPSVLLTANPNPPKATRIQVYQAAKEIDVPVAAIKAVLDVESNGGGFYKDGRPKVLFERHKFYQGLTKIDWITKRDEIAKQHPDICNSNWGAYNDRPQYDKLEIAATLNWDVAHESASWGFGQVMGFNWRELGYKSIRDFVTRMYESEGEQLIAVCRFIKNKGLAHSLRIGDWATFASVYNGSDYARNKYDIKMRDAFNKAKREGWV